MYIPKYIFPLLSRSVWYFDWPHSNFIAKIADNSDDFSRKVEKNSCRNLDANESSESLHNKDFSLHLEEGLHAFALVPRVAALHWSHVL